MTFMFGIIINTLIIGRDRSVSSMKIIFVYEKKEKRRKKKGRELSVFDSCCG